MRVYQYGISAVHDEQAVVAQMLAGHRYQNKLVEIERARRDARNMLCAQYLRPGLDERLLAIEAELEALTAHARKANSEARSKAGDKSALRAAMKPLKDERKELRAERREAMRQIRENEGLQEQFAGIDQAANAAVKAARATTEAYWGTYLLAEDAMKAAKKKPELRFHRWDGQGSVGVQIQNGMLTSEVFSQDTRIRVEPVDPAAWGPSRSARRKACITTLWLRIGSQGPRNTEPVWARFRMHMHRPLPVGLVKRVNVHRRRIGARFRWFVDFVVDCSRQLPDTVGPAAAVDIGWRKLDAGLRVAMLRHGRTNEELILPQEFLDRLRKVRELQSIRKLNFNGIIKRLREWIPTCPDVPEWMREAYAHMHAWKAYGRLVKLAQQWRVERFAGDEEVFAEVEAWRRQDKHLWDWEANQHKRTLLRRREIYRCWSADVCSRFSRVIIEDMDLREFAERPPVEEDTGEDAAARVYRHDAALSELRLALADAASARGVQIVPLDPAWTTRTCHSCGQVTYIDPMVLVTTCECGRSWDQDVNAAINLLASGLGAADSQAALATV